MFDLAMILVILQTVPTELIVVLTPVVVYLAVQLFKVITPVLPGWVLVSIVVPIASALIAWITQLLSAGGDVGFWAQVVLGLLAVFINEIIKQINQARTGS